MQIVPDANTGNAGRNSSLSATLAHAANVMIIINVSFDGTTSPSTVTVGGVNATSLGSSKVSSGTNNSLEVFYYYATAAASSSVVVTFAATTIFSFNAVSYLGPKSTSAAFENVTTNSGNGTSPVTSTVTPALGTNGRWQIQCNGFEDSATGAGSIAVAPAGSPAETERNEQNYAGAASRKANSAQLQDKPISASTAMSATGTKAGRTIYWATCAFGLVPSLDDTMFQMFPQGAG